MKKIYLIFILILLIFSPGKDAFSYGIDFNGVKFYSKMYDGIKELKEKLYTIELPGKEGTKEKIKRISRIDCLTSDLTEGEVKAIVKGRNEFLIKKIKYNCKDKESNVGINTINALTDAVLELDSKTKNAVEGKVKVLLNMSQIGIYSDGLEFNSPFDIIIDIEEINKIIFEEELEYEGDKKFDLHEVLEKVKSEEALKSTIKNDNNPISIKANKNKINNDNKKKELEELLCNNLGNCKRNISDDYQIIKNKYVCDNNISGLKGTTKDILKLKINKKINSSSEFGITPFLLEKIEVENPESDYEKVDDKELFPCDGTFCIKTNFKTYEHNLLGGWGGNNPSIEYILNRSNKHLKKFMNSSLGQAKMTINKFESYFKDLDFSSMFHMRIIIRYEPVPILELDKEVEKNKEVIPEYNLDNMLKRQYKLYGLNYKQSNDIREFKSFEEERKSIMNSTFGNPILFSKHHQEAKKHKAIMADKNDDMKNVLIQEARTNTIKDLKEEYKEIEIFAKNIKNYIRNLDAVLKKMKEIPVDKGHI